MKKQPHQSLDYFAARFTAGTEIGSVCWNMVKYQ